MSIAIGIISCIKTINNPWWLMSIASFLSENFLCRRQFRWLRAGCIRRINDYRHHVYGCFWLQIIVLVSDYYSENSSYRHHRMKTYWIYIIMYTECYYRPYKNYRIFFFFFFCKSFLKMINYHVWILMFKKQYLIFEAVTVRVHE